MTGPAWLGIAASTLHDGLVRVNSTFSFYVVTHSR